MFVAVFAKRLVLCFITLSFLLGVAFAENTTSLEVKVYSSLNLGPISGALVKVYDMNGSVPIDSNYTNSSGALLFQGLQSGRIVRVTADKNGFNSASGMKALTSSTNSITFYMVSQGQNMPDQNVSLTVYVKDANTPVTGAIISVAKTDGGFIQSATSQGSYGSAEFRLPKASYVITASKNGYYINSKTITLTANTAETINLTRLPADQNTNQITASLTVHVKDSNSMNGLTNSTITVTRTDNNAVSTFYTGNNSYATFPGLTITKTYKVFASRSGYNPNSQTLSLTGNTTTTIYLAKSGPGQGELDQNAPDENFSLKVYVYDSYTGAFLVGATATARKAGFSQSASTYSSGGQNYPATFYSIPIGTYYITAAKSGYNPNDQNLIVTSNTETSIDLSMPAVHYLNVTVYSSEGRAVEGAKVGVFRTDYLGDQTKSVAATQTDSLGRANFNNLVDVNYLVVASKTGYSSGQTTTHSDRNVSITITKKEGPGPVDISNLDLGGASGVDFGSSKPELVNINGTQAYQVTGKKSGNLLGFIPVKMDATVLINPKTSKVTNVRLPWWSIFVTS